jgi:iron complex outermembrane receptor protein
MSADFQPDNLYKNDYVKLRELSVAYTLPKKLVNAVHIEKMTVSFNARNLFYFYKTIPNIDSESALGSGSFTEYSFFPSVKSYGFGVNVSF